VSELEILAVLDIADKQTPTLRATIASLSPQRGEGLRVRGETWKRTSGFLQGKNQRTPEIFAVMSLRFRHLTPFQELPPHPSLSPAKGEGAPLATHCFIPSVVHALHFASEFVIARPAALSYLSGKT